VNHSEASSATCLPHFFPLSAPTVLEVSHTSGQLRTSATVRDKVLKLRAEERSVTDIAAKISRDGTPVLALPSV